MELPPALRQAVDAALEGVSTRDLAKDYISTMKAVGQRTTVRMCVLVFSFKITSSEPATL